MITSCASGASKQFFLFLNKEHLGRWWTQYGSLMIFKALLTLTELKVQERWTPQSALSTFPHREAEGGCVYGSLVLLSDLLRTIPQDIGECPEIPAMLCRPLRQFLFSARRRAGGKRVQVSYALLNLVEAQKKLFIYLLLLYFNFSFQWGPTASYNVLAFSILSCTFVR